MRPTHTAIARRPARRSKPPAQRLLDTLEPRLLLTVFNVTPGNLIQPVIDAASYGDTIHIAAGHYAEQLTINGKDLTLTGDGAGVTFIDAPTSLSTSFTTSAVNKAVITFENLSNGNISNLTIDGLNHGTDNARFIGLAYRNAGGFASQLAVKHIADAPADSVQAGVGIYAFDDNGTPNSLTILNTNISGYQKAGISLNGANLVANVFNNTVTGSGPNALVPQNGVQVSFGATGTLSGNKISGNQYTGTQNAQGDAILITQATGLVSVLANDAQHNDGGIVADSPSAILQNTLNNNTYGVELFGAQNGSSLSNNFVQNNSVYGIYLAPDLSNSLVINDNFINGNGQYGLVNASGYTVNAINNWWGSSAGPTTVNSSGGDGLFGYATSSPWLLNGIDAEPTTPGAQPTYPVTGREVFYNNSAYDGNNASANAGDDSAVAPDKTALLPGGTATFANYTSYVNGINGVMVDVTNFAHAAQVTASDFTFKVGTTNDATTWATAPAPISVVVRAGAGPGGADRAEIIWADGAIKNQWVQVTVLANAHTGLMQNDVFYFGNAVGETGDDPSNTQVNAFDEIGARTEAGDLTTMSTAAALNDVYDFNRDMQVNTLDENIVGSNYTNFLNALPLITVGGTVPHLYGTPTGVSNQAAPPAPGNAPAAPRGFALENATLGSVSNGAPVASTVITPPSDASTPSGTDTSGVVVMLVHIKRGAATRMHQTPAPKTHPRPITTSLKHALVLKLIDLFS